MAGDLPQGLRWYPGWLSAERQRALVAEVALLLEQAPLYRPAMPKSGKPLTVTMSNAGSLGWIADVTGYRYQAHHPITGRPWPAIPATILAIWEELSNFPAPPEACLINRYEATARMGLHRDADEAALAAPVLSLSLGDSALFRIGGPERRDPTRSFRLHSGDVLLLGGASRRCYHGVDRILAGSSRLLADGGRLNLTLRRVTHPEPRSSH
ncbi:MAG: alpha-ketoglutarate-dependent dioxygenase AlkB [Rhodospirillales bacterium]